jgi:uncharacterized metal-binding protein YceD (DUF177 family)
MFRIPFSGLSLGHHTFEFHVDDNFFVSVGGENFQPLQDEFSNCDVNIKINLEKTERFLKLDFQIDGDYFVSCDRCLDLIEITVSQEETLIVNFGDENDFDSEVWTISAKEHELILNNFIYETLVLSRPFSVMHNIEDCNPDMIEKLNVGTQHAVPQPESDPRWDALKSLKNNLNKKK